jgi:RNA exonuclease 4
MAIDCEMVGTGPNGSQSVLARVSLVNYHGHILVDSFVKPKERVTDWRTWVSGVRASDMVDAKSFEVVQKEVAELVEGKILVGHAVENDTKVSSSTSSAAKMDIDGSRKALLLSHPSPLLRDTQTFKALREVAKTKKPGLKKLTELELGLKIQSGAHSSVSRSEQPLPDLR